MCVGSTVLCLKEEKEELRCYKWEGAKRKGEEEEKKGWWVVGQWWWGKEPCYLSLLMFFFLFFLFFSLLFPIFFFSLEIKRVEDGSKAKFLALLTKQSFWELVSINWSWFAKTRLVSVTRQIKWKTYYILELRRSSQRKEWNMSKDIKFSSDARAYGAWSWYFGGYCRNLGP